MAEDRVPEKFYKYRSMGAGSAEYVLSTIRNSQIYFASPNAFNDIFDCKPVVSFSCSDDEFIQYYVKLARGRRYSSPEQILAEARTAIGDPGRDPRNPALLGQLQKDLAKRFMKIGVYCISVKNDNILMWSHYANNHSGVCLEFDSTSHEMNLAQRVIYAAERPSIDQLRDQDTQRKMEKALLTKSAHWGYECEWRIIHLVAGPATVQLDTTALTGIIFGAAASAETRRSIRDALALTNPSLPLYQAIANERQFEIRIERI